MIETFDADAAVQAYFSGLFLQLVCERPTTHNAQFSIGQLPAELSERVDQNRVRFHGHHAADRAKADSRRSAHRRGRFFEKPSQLDSV